jgi:hypothetical protein
MSRSLPLVVLSVVSAANKKEEGLVRVSGHSVASPQFTEVCLPLEVRPVSRKVV